MYTPSFYNIHNGFWSEDKNDKAETNNIFELEKYSTLKDKKFFSIKFLTLAIASLKKSLEKLSGNIIQDSCVQEQITENKLNIQFEIDILNLLIEQLQTIDDHKSFYSLLANFINVNRESQAVKLVAAIAAKCLKLEVEVEDKAESLAMVVTELEAKVSKFSNETSSVALASPVP